MTARTYFFWIVLALISGAVLADSSTPQINWAPSLQQARQASAQFKVPLMIHFYGDGCLPCRTLERNVFSNAEVVQILNKFFICVSINGSRDRQAMSQFDVHSYPQDVFLSPGGERLHQGVSPQDVKQYLATLERVAVMSRDSMAIASAKENASAASSATNNAQQSLTTSGGLMAGGPVSNNGVPALPPPGFASQPTSNNPGFYQASGGSTIHQTLEQGSTANRTIQAGPLSAAQQPVSISGSTPPSQHQTGASPFGMVAFQQQPVGQQQTFGQQQQLPAWSTTSATGSPFVANTSTVPMAEIENRLAGSSDMGNSSLTARNLEVRQSTEVGVIVPTTAQAGAVIKVQENPHFTAEAPQPSTAANVRTSLVSTAGKSQTDSGRTSTPGETPAAMLDGYCPVSLRAKQWKRGDLQFAVKHRGLVFHMADQACVDEFLSKPDYYTPILFGNDPMQLLSQGRLVPGSTQHGLFEERVGPLFFASAESKAQFQSDFNNNMRAIEAILLRANGQ